MPDSKRPSGPGQQKHRERAAATTQEEIDETIRERAEGSDAARALDAERDARRAARDAHAGAPATRPRTSRGGGDDPDRS
jgi:hypothetical protein